MAPIPTALAPLPYVLSLVLPFFRALDAGPVFAKRVLSNPTTTHYL